VSHPKLHLDWFSRFSMDHERDQQTDKHIDRSCYSICSNRPHLTIAAMQPKALSTPATMSKQHCRMLQVKQFFPQSRMLILNFVIPTKSKQIKHVQFAYTLSKGLNYIKKTRSTSLPKTATVSKQRSTLSSKQHSTLQHSTMLLRHYCWCGRGLKITTTH